MFSKSILFFFFILILSKFIYDTYNDSLYDVIIVGAGVQIILIYSYPKVSGIVAGEKLNKNLNVIVLEARNRILGRVYTDRKFFKTPMGNFIFMTSNVSDLGASWIHGVKKNPLHKIVSDFGISIIPTNYSETVYYNLTNQQIIKNTYRDRHKHFENMIDDFIASELDQDITTYELFQKFLSSEKNTTKEKMDLLYFNLALLIETEFGDESKYLSAIHFFKSISFEGIDNVLPNGYSELFKKFSENLNIELNSKVIKVEKIESNLYSIMTSDNRIYFTKKVLITVPLGVLKRNSIKFSPPLPKYKIDAIQKLGFGLLNKVILEFERDSLKNIPKMIALVPEMKYGIQSENVGFVSVLNWKHFSNHDYLMVFSHGNFARLIENLNDKEIIEILMKRLSIFNLKYPISHKITRWGKDEFSFGSYSYVKFGSTTEHMDDLRKSINDEIFFAGEATIPNHHQTVHGALLSGKEVSDKIIDEFE
eukprot:gene4239-7576_t